jgi:carbon-monoxide dehydrogenase small subunit
MNERTIRVTVNGRSCEKTVEVRKTLADFLRDDLDLTGTHLGCEHGVCGACTVVLDGAAVRSCLLFAVQAHGRDLQTVEGLADGDRLNPLQEAFRRHHGLQCGFCTPGMMMTARALLDRNPDPDEGEIREAISGQICRCTGYATIVRSVLWAAAVERGDGVGVGGGVGHGEAAAVAADASGPDVEPASDPASAPAPAGGAQ